MKKHLPIIILVLFFLLLIQLSAEDVDITPSCQIEASSGQSLDKILNKSQADYQEFNSIYFEKDTKISISSDKEIGGLYILWDKGPANWDLQVDGKNVSKEDKGFWHEYVEIASAKDVSIILNKSARISQIFIFGKGKLPDFVQKWEEPYEKADLLLLSTHSDDEHLFFAGIIPYYAIEKEYRVQVVYMTNHNDNQKRPHELLNGLWAVGLRHYPVISEFGDHAGSLGTSSEDPNIVLQRALKYYDEKEVTDFQVEIIRRFKPKVIVGHDINGEYGHGAHMVNAYTLMKALDLTNDKDYHKESYEEYGLYEVPKTYLHLWKENKIVMDWDKPMEKANGMTPFEVSKLGYDEHKSQHWTWFTRWLRGEGINEAKDIKTYSPCEYGLYRSLVGEDITKDDFFEKLEPYIDPTPEPTKEPEPSPSLSPSPTEADKKISPSPEIKDTKKAFPYILILIPILLLSLVVVIIIKKR